MRSSSNSKLHKSRQLTLKGLPNEATNHQIHYPSVSGIQAHAYPRPEQPSSRIYVGVAIDDTPALGCESPIMYTKKETRGHALFISLRPKDSCITE